MNIIFDVDCISSPLSGIGRYAYELAQRLQHENVRYLSTNGWVDDLNQLLRPKSSLTLVRNHAILRPLARAIQHRRGQFSMWKNTRALKGYVYHSPNYILKSFHHPSVSTIHDLSHLVFPQFHPQERVNYLNRELPKTLEHATHLIAVSEFVRQEVMQHYGVKPERITTIHHAVADCFKPMQAQELLPVLTQYRLQPGKYLLAVATLEPRKNLRNLLLAYQQCDVALKKEYPLVIVGAKGWLSDALCADIASSEYVQQLGYVAERDLPFVYAGARGFAFPSFYEGFGFPVLEAMASGVPVLTSDRSSLPEVAGDAALLVNPEDVGEMGLGLERLLVDERFRGEAVRRGVERVKGFGWDRCVAETEGVYRLALTPTLSRC